MLGYIHMCIHTYRVYTKIDNFLVSVYQWVGFSSHTPFHEVFCPCAQIACSLLQDPTYAGGPSPASLASSAATAFLPCPCINPRRLFCSQMCQGCVAVTSHGMSFHHHHLLVIQISPLCKTRTCGARCKMKIQAPCYNVQDSDSRASTQVWAFLNVGLNST